MSERPNFARSKNLRFERRSSSVRKCLWFLLLLGGAVCVVAITALAGWAGFSFMERLNLG